MLQTGHQGVKGDAAARAVAQVFVHGDPGVQLQGKCVRQHSAQAGVLPGQFDLAATDTGTGADQGQLCEVAVAAEGKGAALEAFDGQAADEGAFLVVADD